MLRRAHQGGGDSVGIRGFYEHRDKLNAAASFIGEAPLQLNARLLSLYADWVAKWTWNEARLDPQVIKDGIDAVQDAIHRAAWEQWS